MKIKNIYDLIKKEDQINPFKGKDIEFWATGEIWVQKSDKDYVICIELTLFSTHIYSYYWVLDKGGHGWLVRCKKDEA